MTVSECCVDKIACVSYISFEKYVYILPLEMASPGNRHCAKCIGIVSFRVATQDAELLVNSNASRKS